jgi:hypothetical protein
MTTNAIPVSIGMALSRCSSASSPPAEAPIPTIKDGATFSGVLADDPEGSSISNDFRVDLRSADFFMPTTPTGSPGDHCRIDEAQIPADQPGGVARAKALCINELYCKQFAILADKCLNRQNTVR